MRDVGQYVLKMLAIASCSLVVACSGGGHDEILVITNSLSPVSIAIGKYYAEKHGIPSDNIVELEIPVRDPKLKDRSHETISLEQYQQWIREPLERWIEERKLRDSIEILVTTKGIPLRVDGETSSIENWLRLTTQASVDAELSLLFSSRAGSAGIASDINPYFASGLSFAEFRGQHPNASLRYMVARLTGYGNEIDSKAQIPRDVKDLIDASTVSDENAQQNVWLIDEDPSQDPGFDVANRLWLAPTAKILAAMGARVQHDVGNDFVSGADKLAGYSSWGSNDGSDAGAPYYGEVKGKQYPGRFASRSLATDLVSTSGRSFSHPPKYGQSLISDLVHNGVGGAAGHVYEPAMSGVARPHILLPSYAEGTKAIEAYYRSIPYLGWMNVYIGDPLMTIEMPFERSVEDRDLDGVPNESDNCIDVANANQRDTNGDGFGNLCDADVDGDGVVTTSWGAVYPLTKRGDVEWIAMAAQNGPYDANLDLDGDGEINAADISIAHLNLFMKPGPSALAKQRD